jgi:uncharacterized membrane protein
MPSSRLSRYDSLDALRGVAIVWMAIFHFCYDLNYFGWIQQKMLVDPVWTLQRTAIVSLFLFCAGLGQAVATVQGQSWTRFWRRWAQVALCAVLVSVGSWWMFPKTYIHFGVLHGIAVMLILVRLTAHWGRALWALGAVAIAMQYVAVYVHNTSLEWGFLNGKFFNWIGLVAFKPATEDYVPVLPWLGVMWWGMAAGAWLLRRGTQPEVVWFDKAPAPRALAALGRYSLSFYMVHQPVLMGLLSAVAWLRH